MKRRKFMQMLGLSPITVLLPESKPEEFVWKPSFELLSQTEAALRARELFPEDSIRVCRNSGEDYLIKFPPGKWQMAECRFVKVCHGPAKCKAELK